MEIHVNGFFFPNRRKGRERKEEMEAIMNCAIFPGVEKSGVGEKTPSGCLASSSVFIMIMAKYLERY